MTEHYSEHDAWKLTTTFNVTAWLAGTSDAVCVYADTMTDSFGRVLP